MSDTSQTSTIIQPLGSLYSALDSIALPILRLAAGGFLAYHGYAKIFVPGAIEGTAAFFGKVGYSMPYVWATLVAYTEFVGGILLAIGLLTRPAALAIIIFLINAVIFHSANGFFWNARGFEYPALWAIVTLVFLIRGGGWLSIDRAIGKEF